MSWQIDYLNDTLRILSVRADEAASLGNEIIAEYYINRMAEVKEEIKERKRIEALSSDPIAKPNALDQVKFVAMSGYDSGVMH